MLRKTVLLVAVQRLSMEPEAARFWPQQCPVADMSTEPGQAASQVGTLSSGVSAPAGE